jgi:arylsulfatase A-like enzyme
MNRRGFLKKSGVAAAGIVAAPYILPSGRLFAATGMRKVNHVVFCLYAGGVRNIESVHKADGNLMPNILTGNESISSNILGAMDPLPSNPLPMALQNYGTLFKEFRYKEGPTGHYNGHTTAITGKYTAKDLDIKAHPETPTVFEFYRKHTTPSVSPLNCWWVSNQLGPYPALNFSKYPGYGSLYGANFIAPTYLISNEGYNQLGSQKTFSAKETEVIGKMKAFMDKNFKGQASADDAGIFNAADNAAVLQEYINTSFQKAYSGAYNDPWGAGQSMNGDMYNVFFAEELIKKFKPELLVVNMQGVDVCHTEFGKYCNNLRKADYAVAHLWKTIQETPGMANDTIMIVAPEHGRNLNGNSIVDNYGRAALDHTGDDTSREIFCLVVGPPGVVKQNQVISAASGESIEIVPTIANILGFESEIPGGMLKNYNSCDMQAAFI